MMIAHRSTNQQVADSKQNWWLLFQLSTDAPTILVHEKRVSVKCVRNESVIYSNEFFNFASQSKLVSESKSFTSDRLIISVEEPTTRIQWCELIGVNVSYSFFCFVLFMPRVSRSTPIIALFVLSFRDNREGRKNKDDLERRGTL